MKAIIIRKLALFALLFTLPMAFVHCGGGGGGSNPSIFGVDGPEVDLVNGNFILTLALKNVSTDTGITLPFRKYPNSSLFIGPDFASGGTLLIFTISVADYERFGFEGLEPQVLPGGRPLPGVSGGSLPAIAFEWKKLPGTKFYVGHRVLGVFVPVSSLRLGGLITTHRFYDVHGVRVGNISLVGEDSRGENSGVLVLINVDARIRSSVNSHMRSL